MTSSGGNPRLTRSSAACARPPDREQHFLAVRSHAERDQQRDRGRLFVETNARHRPVEDEPNDRLVDEQMRVPGVPVSLHLTPGPADHILADRARKRRGKRKSNPPRVGSGKIDAGDQSIGGSGTALLGPEPRRSAIRASCRPRPIVEKQNLGGDSSLLRGIFRHGVVSVPAR